jgi:hypothetical protein
MEFPISGSGSLFSRDGLVVQLVTITHAEEVVPRFDSIDKSLKLVVKDEQQREFDMYLDGTFKKDQQTSAVIDIGSAFRITDVFNKTGVKGRIASNESIPTEMLGALVGKTIWRLRYPTERREDKVRYRTWQIIEGGSNTQGWKTLKDRFLKEHADKGFPRDYNPDVLLEQSNLTKTDLPTETESSEETKADY